MASSGLQREEPMLPDPEEMELAARSTKKLAEVLSRKEGNRPIAIQISDGETVVLPLSAFRIFIQVLTQMAQGNAVTLIPIHAHLTTQEAADLLNVSRPHLIKLLEKGEIPFEKVGTHRRIKAQDLFKYRAVLEESKKHAMDQLTEQAQDLDLGY